MPERAVGGAAPVLQIAPSRRCNLACGHCSSSSGPREEQSLSKPMLLSAIRDAATLGYRHVSVSGGEPLLSPDLLPVLRRARALELGTSVTTNGLLLGQRAWDRVADLVDVLEVSIDGTEAEHDALRGRDGAYAQTVRNLGAVRRTGTPFGLVTTLTQYNAASLESVVQLAAREGARSVQVRPLALVGRARETMSDERPDGIELAAALIEARRLGERYGVFVHVDALTADQLVLYRGDLVPPFPARSITQLAPVLVVEASGAVRPLAAGVPNGVAIGSLHRAPLARLVAVWERSARARELAAACDRAWWELTAPGAAPAAAWHDEVVGHIAPEFVRPAADAKAAGPSAATSAAKAALPIAA